MFGRDNRFCERVATAGAFVAIVSVFVSSHIRCHEAHAFSRTGSTENFNLADIAALLITGASHAQASFDHQDRGSVCKNVRAFGSCTDGSRVIHLYFFPPGFTWCWVCRSLRVLSTAFVVEQDGIEHALSAYLLPLQTRLSATSTQFVPALSATHPYVSPCIH